MNNYNTANIICEFLVNPSLKLLDWIPMEKLNRNWLKNNPKFFQFNKKEVSTETLWRNPLAISFIEFVINNDPDDPCIFWEEVCANPEAIHLIKRELKRNPDNIDWRSLSSNPNAIDILRENMRKICWWSLSENPNAISLLQENIGKINWEQLSKNTNAIPILEKNKDKIYWKYICMNPNATHIIKTQMATYPERINWASLSNNPNALSILKDNMDRIDWDFLSLNPNIFCVSKQHYKSQVNKLVDGIFL